MDNTKTSPASRVPPAFILAAAAVCLAVFLFVFLSGSHLPADARIAGTDVGGMTRLEARQALKEAESALASTPMVVRLPRETLELAPADTGVRLKPFCAIQAAMDSEVINADACLRWKKDTILSRLESYARQYNTAYTESTCQLEGQAPQLAESAVSGTQTGQTLVVTLGTPEFTLDVQALYDQILNAYCTGSFLVDWQDAQPSVSPPLPDWEAIYQQYRTEPVNAALDMETCEAAEGSFGSHFDLAKARALAKRAEPGAVLRIPMEYLEPEFLTEDLYFRDVLGTYTSGHSDRPSIVENLNLVCQFLNGIVIQPGEEFSFNGAVGERTVERGFYYGESFTGFERSRSAGGGVCQASSVLHVAVLEADLEVLERVCHGMVVSYTPLGQDAAVSWPGPDFRFRNNTRFPIKILAENDQKNVRIQLMGTDERDYYIVLEATQGHDEHQVYANCYKRKYDKETDQLISRELAVHSAYQYNG